MRMRRLGKERREKGDLTVKPAAAQIGLLTLRPNPKFRSIGQMKNDFKGALKGAKVICKTTH